MSTIFTVEEKGKLIESVIMNIFLASGLRIFENGFEMRHHDFYNYFIEQKKLGLVKKYDSRLKQLLSIPDFVVKNQKNEYDFAEVKFRSIHCLSGNVIDELVEKMHLMSHFDQCRKIWKPEIILVTSEPLDDTSSMFSVISYPYYKDNNGKINLLIKKITDIEKWKINPKMVEAYESIVTQLLSS